jgi:hypothetical protein
MTETQSASYKQNLITAYLQKRAQKTAVHYQTLLDAARPLGAKQFPACCVIMPLYDEYPNILDTLASLEKSLLYARKNPRLKDAEIAVVCVVNNRASCDSMVKENNQQTLDLLRSYAGHFALDVIDCASPGREISGGVGQARKIGMDYAVARAASCNAANGAQEFFPCLAMLDGDTLVRENYVQALFDFAASKKSAALTEFLHQKNNNAELENAIRIYEDFLRGHSECLKACGTPYYHIALGPTIVCSLEAYCASGGMNVKDAGEDFYFLQSLIKLCLGRDETIAMLDCAVYPQSRLSCRVPFGTGQKIAGIAKNPAQNLAYSPKAYASAAFFIEQATCADNSLEEKLRGDSALYDFLIKENFFAAWQKIKEKTLGADLSNKKALCRAFHTWFDGLKIIRLIRIISER